MRINIGEAKWFYLFVFTGTFLLLAAAFTFLDVVYPIDTINRDLPIPQVNLAKIYVLATEIRKDMKENPDLFDEEPNEHMIRNMLVFSQDYGECREPDMNWDETLACRDTITQREVDLVRLAYTDLDSFTIEVEE